MYDYGALLAQQRAEVLPALMSSTRRLRWSQERLAQERTKRLRFLLGYAAGNSPFWRRQLAGRDIASITEADLRSLPVLTKAELMDNFDEIVTDRSLSLQRVDEHVEQLEKDSYLDGRYRAVATSGSGGRRALFVYDWDEWIAIVTLIARWLSQRLDEEDVIGTVFATNVRHISGALHAFWRGRPGGSQVVTLPASLPLPEIVAGFNAAQPTVLQGYPSMIQLLAAENLAGHLRIRPRKVLTCGEQCTRAVREVVRRAWEVDVYDYWGCSEGVYAFPCDAGRAMHLPDDLAIVEPVDRDWNPVAFGEPAEKILLTNLYNKTQPLIRYEVTDAMTVLDGPCACGCAHRRIARLHGRSEAVFLYENGIAVHPVGMETVLLGDPGVVEFQVSQTADGAVVSVVCRGEPRFESLRARLNELMVRSGVPDPVVTIRPVDSLDRMWSGKLRQFEPLPAGRPHRAPAALGPPLTS